MVKHVIIMAGGSGTRLWPASRRSTPKQFLDLGQGRSLFQATLERSMALAPEGMILVVTHQSQVQAIIEQAAAADPGRLVVLPEPIARNTAPAVAYACAFLAAAGEAEASVIVLASDHDIRPVERFRQDVAAAAELAAAERLVVFGIPPTRPETGYGYVESGTREGSGFLVQSFHEKPTPERAGEYLEAGTFFWNSGMFVFRVGTFLEEARRHAPEVAGPLEEVPYPAPQAAGVSVIPVTDALTAAYERLPAISIDYAIMERSDRVAMIRARFDWSDVGSWDEVARIAGDGGAAVSIDSEGSYVYADVPVALAGVKDLIVVVRDGVVLVCGKGSSQLVRGVVDRLKEAGPEDLL